MADPNWHPWTRVRKDNGMWGYEAKPLELHPVVHTLLQSSAFVARAKAWSWAEQTRKGGTTEVNTGTNFAPWISSPREGVASYFEAVMRTHRAHAPHLIPPDEMICSLSGQTALALDLSAANPLLVFN